MKTEIVKLSQVQLNGSNPRQIKDEKFAKLINSILALPKMLELRPIVVDDTMVALGGNMRYRALAAIADMDEAELKERLLSIRDVQKKTAAEQEALADYWLAWRDAPTAPVIKASDLTAEEQREFIIKDNVGYGEWDMDALANEWDAEDLVGWGMEPWEIGLSPEEGAGGDGASDGSASKDGSLQDRFVVPPFSVLDTRKGYWQARKKLWREKIGDMGESRNDKLITSPEIKYKDLYLKTRKHREELGISFREYIDKYVPADVLAHEESKVLSAGVSLFDPVLSEIMCRWFTPNEHSAIFDCFAGDTQKGLVFALCGHSFRGIELRPEQVEINNRVINGRGLDIAYICDDGQNVAQHIAPDSQDLLFSCPPYYDLEVYSDDPKDASNQGTYGDFIKILDRAFKAALGCLRENRFAVIVVGDVRDKKTGFYYDFCGDIKRIFREAGVYLYNECILVETGASTALRASRYMDSRKVGKMHQNVLIFYKGNPAGIKKQFPRIEYSEDDLAMIEQAVNEGLEPAGTGADGAAEDNEN